MADNEGARPSNPDDKGLTMKLDRERIDRIRAAVDLPSLLLERGVSLRKSGNGYIAKCINHDDNVPSMSVYEKNGHMRCMCHSCEFSEDVIGVYMKFSGVDFKQALDDLDTGEIKPSIPRPFGEIADEKLVKAERTVFPPPDDAPEPPYARAQYRDSNDEWKPLGEPETTWCYRTAEGKPYYYEARYINPETGRKEPRCWTWGNRGSMPARWELGFPPAPRPIYGLNELAAASQVLICEGPKKAQAARMMLNGTTSIACVAWAGGSGGVSRSDWSAIEGKKILLFPDSDESGLKAINRIAGIIKGKVESIHYINTWDMPHTWDAADAQEAGWTKEQFFAFLKERKTEYQFDDDATEPELCMKEPSPPIEAYMEHSDDGIIQWPEPLDLFSENLAPKVKANQIPAVISDWAFDNAGVIGCDPTFLVMPAIVAAASLLHDEIQVQPERTNPNWRESARLWGAMVGLPSSKKSPALARALSVIKKIDAECNMKEGALKYEYSLQEKAHAANEKAYIDKLSKGEKNIPLPVKPDMPEIPRPYAQDFTIEALRDILKHSNRGILAERDELSGWFASHDQYKSGGKGGGDAAAWLEVYNGGSRRIERVGVGSIFVKNWSASIIGGIQPEPMRAIAAQLKGDGLLQRFMIVSGRSGTQGNKQTPIRAYEDSYKQTMRQIWDTVPSDDPVYLSPGADAIREEIVAKAYSLINMQFISEGLMAHLGKWEGLSARLMLTYHGIECASRHVHPQACEITEDTAEQVKAFMLEMLLPHATYFYMDIAGGDMGKQLIAVGNLIISRKKGEITLRDIMQGWVGWRHLSESQQGAIINRLIDAGWLHTSPEARTAKNRSLVSRYLVNPRLHELFAKQADAEIKRRAEAAEIISTIKYDANRD